ncbi:alpha/beta fold hydrolase [Sandaracinus amylolyticus]|uniref:Polyhydroxyalkanoic acid synthase n=1 Tax=Sandaracinus amylolyticus TaxID=927083 RepID=A0A0F6W653_9BACT|nr:alpha/beta fold hydrolase [Sandaracinus amylolyticus]AKF08405.1 Polyhydroxyalkanoic acid synthase [Sandaracinus amylolyticus]
MSVAALLAVATGIAFLVATIAHYRYWVKRLTVPLEYVLEERIETPDGSAIELRRLPPLREEPGGVVEPAPEKVPEALSRPPVLLVHGIGINHQNNDMLPDLSLARHLATAGRDCWLLTLRTGRSDARLRERGLMRFERMARHDLPIGIARVLELTGAKQLDYVGFSMGGILLYGSIARTVDPALVRKVVIIGSPGIVKTRWPLALFAWTRFLPWWLVPTIPLRLASRMFAFIADVLPATPLHRIVYNPANVERGIAGASLMTIQDLPAALAYDLVSWVGRGGPCDGEGRPVVERLEELEIPALFFAGAADQIAPPDSVRAAYDAWARDRPAVEKTFVLLGREAGASEDYGHGDLAIGRRAREEIFEPVEAFLGR